jgi:hypothetical protein
MAVQRKQAYEALKAAAQPFMDNYHRICGSMVFSHDWFSGKAWAWHDVLAPMRGESADILEVGVFEGRSVVFCLEYLPLSKVIAVDHFVIKKGWTSSEGNTLAIDSEEAFDRNIARYGKRVKKITSSLWKALAGLIYDKCEFDVIYVDAAHTAPDVLADSLLAWRMLKVGGLFIWDDFMLDVWDIGPKTVTQGVCTFLEMYKGQYEWAHAGWQVIVRKTAAEQSYILESDCYSFRDVK